MDESIIVRRCPGGVCECVAGEDRNSEGHTVGARAKSSNHVRKRGVAWEVVNHQGRKLEGSSLRKQPLHIGRLSNPPRENQSTNKRIQLKVLNSTPTIFFSFLFLFFF